MNDFNNNSSKASKQFLDAASKRFLEDFRTSISKPPGSRFGYRLEAEEGIPSATSSTTAKKGYWRNVMIKTYKNINKNVTIYQICMKSLNIWKIKSKISLNIYKNEMKKYNSSTF